jgi:predicted dehydrogenase
VKKPVRIAVLGAGLIGQRHIQQVKDEPKAELVAIVDPALEAKALAESLGVKWSADYEALLKSDKPDGAIFATPNLLHLSRGLASIEAGVSAHKR